MPANSPTSMTRFLVSLFAAIALIVLDVAFADEVTLRSGEGNAPFVVEGRVVDWTGESITVQRAVGSPRRYDAARVVKVDTDWPTDYSPGLERLAAGESRAAAELLLKSAREEQRPWARRQIMAALTRAYAAGGAWGQAGDTWLAVLNSDPTSAALGEAPLAWFAIQGIPAAKLEAWMESKRPHAQLLAASHQLQTSRRTDAAARLEKLRLDLDPRIAQLATAQLWRTRLGQATADEVDQWQGLADKWGDARGGGPWLVIAEARAQLGDHDAALLAAMRPAILASRGSSLAARGLLVAARSAAANGQADEARRLAGELLRDYRENPQRGEAEALLDSLR